MCIRVAFIQQKMRGAGALGNVVKGKETLAAAGMHGGEGHLAQIRLRLAPTGMVNS
jgi:hypothetical protein